MRFFEDQLDTLTCADGVGRTIHIWTPGGFVFSSPYYRNALPVPAVLVAVSGVLSARDAPRLPNGSEREWRNSPRSPNRSGGS